MTRRAWFVLGMLLAPFALLSAFLLVTRRWFPLVNGTADYWAIAAAVAAGLAFAWALLRDVRNRYLYAAAYVIATAGLLMWYALVFVCVALGDCL